MDFGGPTNEGATSRRSYGPPGGGSSITFGGPVPVGERYTDKPASSSNPYAATYNKENDVALSSRRAPYDSPQSYRAPQRRENTGSFLEHNDQSSASLMSRQPPQQQYPPQQQQYPPQQQHPPQQQYPPQPSQQQQYPPQQQHPPQQQYPPQPSQQQQYPTNPQQQTYQAPAPTSQTNPTSVGDHRPTGAGSKPSLFLATGRPGQSMDSKQPSGVVTRRDMVWEQKRQKYLEKQNMKKQQPAIRQSQFNQPSAPGHIQTSQSQFPHAETPNAQYDNLSHSAREQLAGPPSPLSMLVRSNSREQPPSQNLGGGGYQQHVGGGYQQNMGGGYQQNMGGGYQQNTGGGYQQNTGGAPYNVGGGHQQSMGGGGYQQNMGGGYQQNTGGAPHNVGGGYQQSMGGGGYQQNMGGGYQQNTGGAPHNVGGGYQQSMGGGGYQQNMGGGGYQESGVPPINLRPGSGRRANTGSSIAYGSLGNPNSSQSSQAHPQVTSRRGVGSGGGSSQITFG